MAVIKRIEVTVRVNKNNLHEFNDEDSHPDTTSISKYIEASSGVRFEIIAIVPSSYKFASNALGFEASLDGNLVERGLVFEHQYHNYVYTFRGVTRLSDSGWEIRPYRFAQINIMEEPSTQDESRSRRDRIAELGTIRVKVFNKTVKGPSILRTHQDRNLLSKLHVAEKELKGGNVTHTVELGKSESAPAVNFSEADYFDGKGSPIAMFTFKYCSRATLQNLMLIPRSPSPIPLEERPIETLSQAEKDELVRRQQARYRAERANNVKREGYGTPAPAPKSERGVKRERDEEMDEILASSSARKVKTRPFTKGEIVELD